jgi:uncharacterized protein (DUF2141 family)
MNDLAHEPSPVSGFGKWDRDRAIPTKVSSFRLNAPSSFSSSMPNSGLIEGRTFMFRLATGIFMLLAATGTGKAAQLTVQVEGASPGQGAVLVGVCSGSLDIAACGFNRSVQPPAGEFQIVFPDLPEGSYAVAAFQDTNGNNTLDRDPNGLPREPYAFSNGTGRTAPPSFEAARITVRGNVAARIRLGRSPLAR